MVFGGNVKLGIRAGVAKEQDEILMYMLYDPYFAITHFTIEGLQEAAVPSSSNGGH